MPVARLVQYNCLWIIIALLLVTMATNHSLRQNIFIIGDIDTQIVGNKLPSKLQVLKVLFFNLRLLKKTLRDASLLLIDEVEIFWRKGQIPTRTKWHCIEKVEKLYNQCRDLQKHKDSAASNTILREFKDDLCNLFDIAHANVFDMITEEQADFLNQQRQPGRNGYIGNIGIDVEVQPKAETALHAQPRLRREMEIDMLGTLLNKLFIIKQGGHSYENANFSDFSRFYQLKG